MNFFKKGYKDGDGPAKKIAVADILDNLPFLEEAEKTVAEFYLLCAEVLPDNKDFWLSMAASELRHAENVRKMLALIKKEPKKYRSGYPFNPASIRAFVMYLQDLVEKMRKGEIPVGQVLSLAADIEDSAVEVHYGDIVETGVEEFNLLAREIDGETTEHRSSLDLLIKGPQSG